LRVDIFTIADFAEEHAGKLFITGSFDGIMAFQVPYTHPAMSVAIRLRFEDTEAGEHTHQLLLIDEDGKYLVKAEGRFEIQLPPERRFTSVQYVMNFLGIQFAHYGEYEFRLLIDQQEAATTSLFIAEPPPHMRPPV
jgi:hypothetical protein